MSDYYIGEVRLFPQANPPRGWIPCDGRLLPIIGNQALFSLYGTFYGGDGSKTFGIPDLRGRVPIHMSVGSNAGTRGGTETVALTVAQMTAHNHSVEVVTSSLANVNSPNGNYYAQNTLKGGVAPPSGAYMFGPLTAPVPLAAATVGTVGVQPAVPHPNVQPSLVLNFCVATTGIYPPRP